jgi:ABC-type iron transport system FetAB ATPase subunit
MRSSDIAARCREIALRVQCSGEWGELAETLTQAATEVERLRLEGCDLRKSLFAVHDDLGRVWLTKKEKKAVQFAVDHFGTFKSQANTLREIIERLGGGE